MLCPVAVTKKRHGCPCKLPQCFSNVNAIYSWSSLTWWLVYTQEKFRNGLADQYFVRLCCYLSQVLQLQGTSVGEINYIKFSEIFPGWTHWTQNVPYHSTNRKILPSTEARWHIRTYHWDSERCIWICTKICASQLSPSFSHDAVKFF